MKCPKCESTNLDWEMDIYNDAIVLYCEDCEHTEHKTIH